MKTDFVKSGILLAAVLVSISAMSAKAATTTLNFNYMATASTAGGAFTGDFGSNGISVATLTLTDFIGDGSTVTDQLGTSFVNNGGVRATFSVNAGGLTQFNTALEGTGGSAFISAYELNFPATTGANGYDGTGIGNLWKNVSGTPLTGGIEWQENGTVTNTGWGAGVGDPAFGQEFNFGTPTAFTAGGNNGFTEGSTSTIDMFNPNGRTDLSVANILSNPVLNATNSTVPSALGWIKIRSNTLVQDATGRGIDSNGWWGNSVVSGTGTALNYRLNVLAVTPVPEPSTFAMLVAGLGFIGSASARRKVK